MAISLDAAKRHVFINVVDDPHLCTFIMPAIIDRSPVTVAIVYKATQPDQRVLISDLIKVVAKVYEEKICSPSMIIIGSVISPHGQLDKFVFNENMKAKK